MGAIRGILLVFVLVLLFFSFLSVNIFWTLSSSLSYENLQKKSVDIVGDFLQEINVTTLIKQNYPLIQFYCKNYSSYVFNYQGYTFDIPCTTVLSGEKAIIEEGVKDLLQGIYYEKYECTFIDCFKKTTIPLFLISQKAHDFWKNKLYLCLIASLVLLILTFLLVEKKINTFILSGSLLIVSALPFIKLDSILSIFSDRTIFKFLGIFFSQAHAVSVKILIIGGVLLIFGIILSIFKIGFSISNFISKIKENRDKKEAPKSNKKQIKKSK